MKLNKFFVLGWAQEATLELVTPGLDIWDSSGELSQLVAMEVVRISLKAIDR